MEVVMNIFKGIVCFLMVLVLIGCDEEEELLRSVYLQKRSESAIPEHYFVHFDIPLTLEHESGLLQNAGFIIEKVLDGSDGATIITARKNVTACASYREM